MMKMHARYVALLAAGLSSTVGCGAVGGVVEENGVVAEALNVPSAVATGEPNGLVESTGNLYWTRNATTGAFPYRWVGRVYRAAKTSTPGQEVLLYSETGTIGSSFGNITFANYGGVFYGYFVASYLRNGTYIKRVPLDGSSAAITFGDTPSLASPSSQILSDGMYLFFYGANGLYAAPLDGGHTLTIATASGITGIGIDRAHVYYSVGNQLHWLFKPNYGSGGGAISGLSAPITSMYVNAGADNDDLKTTIAATTATKVYQWSWNDGWNGLADATRYGTPPQFNSVSAAGSRVMWTSCDVNNVCFVQNMNPSTQDFNHFQFVQTQTGTRSIMGDETNMFFIDDYGLERLAY
jgi:hypothetical protein